jgi:hypothetical protein
MKKPADNLEAAIEKSLTELLGGKSEKSKEEKDELRSNVLLAIKWQAVKLKKSETGWGSGFKPANGEEDDAGLDDD